MKTARSIVLVNPGFRFRPNAPASVAMAREGLDRLTGAEPVAPVRFAGWDNRQVPQDMTPGTRCAVYEADYPDTA